MSKRSTPIKTWRGNEIKANQYRSIEKESTSPANHHVCPHVQAPIKPFTYSDTSQRTYQGVVRQHDSQDKGWAEHGNGCAVEAGPYEFPGD
jgi:hypothetical protein